MDAFLFLQFQPCYRPSDIFHPPVFLFPCALLVGVTGNYSCDNYYCYQTYPAGYGVCKYPDVAFLSVYDSEDCQSYCGTDEIGCYAFAHNPATGLCVLYRSTSDLKYGAFADTTIYVRDGYALQIPFGDCNNPCTSQHLMVMVE